jgi:hypothetical protein
MPAKLGPSVLLCVSSPCQLISQIPLQGSVPSSCFGRFGRGSLSQKRRKLLSGLAWPGRRESGAKQRQLLDALLVECDKMAAAASGRSEAELRPITAADLAAAREEVTPSVSPDSAVMAELRQWNATYGEGAKRELWNPKLSYFL